MISAFGLLLITFPAGPLESCAAADVTLAVDAIWAGPTGGRAEQLDPLVKQSRCPELTLALEIMRGRLIELETGATSALVHLQKLRGAPASLAQVLSDEQIRMARQADDSSTVMLSLCARVTKVGPTLRQRYLGEIVERMVEQRYPPEVAAARKCLEFAGEPELAALAEAHYRALRGAPAKSLEELEAVAATMRKPVQVDTFDAVLTRHGLTDRLIQKLGRSGTFSLILRYLDAGRPEGAKQLLDRLEPRSDLAVLQLRTLTDQRRYAAALAVADTILAEPARPITPFAAMERAKLLGRLGRLEEARTAYADFARTYKKDPGAEQAAFFSAWLLHEAGRAEMAAEQFGKLIAAAPRSPLAGKCRWLRAFNLVRAGDLKPALDALTALLAAKPSYDLANRARYLRGQTLAMLEQPAAAAADFRAIATGPIGPVEQGPYYRAIASAALRDLDATATGSPPPPRCTIAAVVPGLGATSHLRPYAKIALVPQSALAVCPPALRDRALTLARQFPPDTGRALVALATTRLCAPTARLLRDLQPPRGAARTFLETLELSGDATRTLRKAKRALASELRQIPTPGNRWAWQLGYPMPPFAPLTAIATPRSRLMLAIARHESHFITGARSAVGALGLMQVMPATGHALGLLHDWPPVDDAQLLDPRSNIDLAAGYLTLLHEEFGGQLPLMIAAYNAGPEAVRGWWERHHDLPLGMFVETIPFRETRAYVKKVLSALTIYGWLAGDEDPEFWARRSCLNTPPLYQLEF